MTRLCKERQRREEKKIVGWWKKEEEERNSGAREPGGSVQIARGSEPVSSHSGGRAIGEDTKRSGVWRRWEQPKSD
jgi:hypothetical protein